MQKLLFLIPVLMLAACAPAHAADLLTGGSVLDLSALALQGLAGSDGAALAFGMGGIVINAANLKDVFTGFKTSFQQGLNSAPAPMWNQVATEVPSTTEEEDYGWLGDIPGMREWIGDRHIHNLSLSDYSIRNKEFELTVGVKRTKIEDGRFGIFAPMMEQLGYSAATNPDELVFQLLAAGFDTECYDKQFFFDTDHPVGDGVVSNMQAGGGNPWFLLDTRRPLKPLIFQNRKPPQFVSMINEEDESVFTAQTFRYGVDARRNVGFGFWQMAFGSKATLDETNYEAAKQAMMTVKNDHGRPLGISPNLLVCGSSNEAAGKRLIKKELVAAGESNIHFNDVDLLVVPWLT